mmetsp:Transcript_36824/g.95359  ORF Transcript_36824/g.95359 Transcript_36824/m.95359 type:complete len:165 (-) Transcript_36824:239-733(-)|eukprot:CAMPEP_0113870560 /NCGR_PEP_ID=MMETSP0780_2-20120614/2157_1 /TAXON_ID=652834 /ORGANISM="Palpitomonas bilix" /LENGTH=164 /DNA_ID=CAMNT_0000855857 /DNA_START=311 /DNA_END=805 /DNA_ORIENTATION=- /assembly_acc=CAM_ASM_000599
MGRKQAKQTREEKEKRAELEKQIEETAAKVEGKDEKDGEKKEEAAAQLSGGVEFSILKGAKYSGEEGSTTVFESLQHKQNREVMMKLIRYSFLMFTFPFAVFYLVYYYGHDLPYLDNENNRLMGSAMASVLAANIVIVAYVVSAWNEPIEDKRRGKAGPRPKRA